MSELSIVARAINALTAFGVTTEREAGQLLPMWLHYGEMTADDRTAVYRHYRTELAGGFDDWPLPAVEIEDAEQAGLVVRPAAEDGTR